MPTKAASDAVRALVALHYAKLTPQQRSAMASHAATAIWKDLTPTQRKAETKRRLAGKGKRKLKKKARRAA